MTRTEQKQFFAKCGTERKRNRMKIRAALLHNEKTERTIANQLGITPQAVCRVIAGLAHTPAILDALRQAGVPEKYIHDPRLGAGNAK